MNVRHSKISIELTEHLDKDAVFYAFTLRGVRQDQVIPWVEKMLADLKRGHTILVNAKEDNTVKQSDISEVLEKIIREVPGEWEGRIIFLGRLRHLQNAARTADDALIRKLWDTLAGDLQRNLGDPDEEWKRRIASIFAGRNSI